MKFKQVFESDVKRNSGENDLRSAHQVDSSSKEDMDAFDQFGPKTRAVMNDMPVKWSAAQTLNHVRGMGMEPSHPQVDAQIAQHLKQAASQISREVRVESVIIDACEKMIA